MNWNYFGLQKRLLPFRAEDHAAGLLSMSSREAGVAACQWYRRSGKGTCLLTLNRQPSYKYMESSRWNVSGVEFVVNCVSRVIGDR